MSMVSKVPCGVCASPVPNNLVAVGGAVAFVHNDQILVRDGNERSDNLLKRHTGTAITAIRTAFHGNDQVIVTTSATGVKVWDANVAGPLDESVVTDADTLDRCQALCIRQMAGSSQICVGTSTGSVHLYITSPSSSLSQAAVLDGDGVPVLALEWLTEPMGNLCASTANGQVSIFKTEPDKIEFYKSVSMSLPVILLGSAQQKIFCGSIQGDITVLEQDTLTVVMEIAAHSRFLSTMVLHTSEFLLLTAAQDGTATVWDLTQLEDNKVSVVQSYLWNNAMITGGCFGPKNRFFLSSYSGLNIGLFEYTKSL